MTELPVRIEPDRLALQRADRDRERLRLRRRRDADVRARRICMLHEIREPAHAAHRVADEAGELLDAEAAYEREARVRHVLERESGKIEPIELAGRGIRRRRPGRALARAERVRTDHEPAVRVDVFAGADHLFPPARRRIVGVRRRVRARREAGQDEDGVAAFRVERAPRFVGERRAREGAAAFHRKRRGQIEIAAGIGHAQAGPVGRTRNVAG